MWFCRQKYPKTRFHHHTTQFLKGQYLRLLKKSLFSAVLLKNWALTLPYFRVFIVCILVYLLFFRFFIEKSTPFFIFSPFTRQKATFLLNFSPSKFQRFAQFQFLFSKLYSRCFSYFLMVYLDVQFFSWYNKCQKTNVLMQLTSKE